ncbi:hypothetical protein Moror_1052 [Moniliophthora roreri MCA 2997]|uniref:Mitochondrial fission process protein 1 n=1 Tax=Moniliophthora roreri (strain MCA 2997) TaxID=1381753 RepID=V2XJ73_MONRO|nr:hypothetical protein Moror_1052 [Moniliophthora roreri MCA 2997]
MLSTTTTTIDSVEKTVDKLADQNVDSTDSELRYAAYGARLRTALRASSRYIAVWNSISISHCSLSNREIFIPPWVVTLAYGISWAYLSGDVAYEGYKANRRGPTPFEAANFSESTRISLVAVQRATFQSIASMALPAFTIHTAVKQAKKAFVNVKNPRIKMWGLTLTGLAIIPSLPYIFDHPVEHVTEKAFEWIKERLAAQKDCSKGEDGKHEP